MCAVYACEPASMHGTKTCDCCSGCRHCSTSGFCAAVLRHACAQVQEALRQYNVQGVHPSLHAYLNQAVWLHIEGLLSQACKMASQRADLSRWVQHGLQCLGVLKRHLNSACKCVNAQQSGLESRQGHPGALPTAQEECLTSAMHCREHRSHEVDVF